MTSKIEKLKARKAKLDRQISTLNRKEAIARRKKEDTAKFTLGALVMKLCAEKPGYKEKILEIFYTHLPDDLELMNETRRAALKDVWHWDIATYEDPTFRN